jgi:hypothetical protein
MRKFNVCYPDANNFNNVIKLKSVDTWEAEYTKVDDDIGYWVAEDPFEDNGFELFKELVAQFPIVKDNNHPSNFDPNPFDSIHLPNWVYQNVSLLVRDFYIKHYNPSIVDPQIHEWGNVYYKEQSNPITCWRIPHVDYDYGMVGNLWFTGHTVEDSCTNLYKYTGKIIDMRYDFQVDESHPKFKDWLSLSRFPKRAEHWFNFDEDFLKEWGFELVGKAPCNERTMTLYNANVSHLAYISDNVDFRWSHTFAYSHLNMHDTLVKDIIR